MAQQIAWMVIVNPKAGRGRGLTDWPVISNQMNKAGIVFTCVFTEHKYHAVELTVKALRDGYRRLVVVGGDGTVHEVVNGIFHQKEIAPWEVTLSVIPTGTGNDWVRMFGIPHTYNEAVQAMVEYRTVLQDVGRVSFVETRISHIRYMANVAGLGFDAMVNRKYNRLRDEGRKGKWLYLTSALRVLLGYRATRFRVEVDGRLFFDGKIFSATVGIGKYNGGGMIQMPYAEVNDGLLDMTLIRKASKIWMIRNFKHLFDGQIYQYPKVLHAQGRMIRIETWPPSPIEIDGEALGYAPFTFEILPQSLLVVVGRKFQI
ncbi:MAG: diacylglycerol kinase family lipid kinase [Bacteroidales bacterium]|nr:diacylglycerol kinase family lipid kinase [Bacteroidales bacterium]